MPEPTDANPVTDNSQDVSSGETGTLLTPETKPLEDDSKSASQNSPSSQQPASQFPAWMAQLEGNLKSDTALTKFKTLSELGKAYRELEGKLGKAVVPPDENAKPEDIEAYYKKLGRPDKPENYALETKAPKEIVSEELTKAFKEQAHKLGLPQKSAQELYSWYTEKLASQVAEVQNRYYEQAKYARQQAEQTLKAEFGPAFDENMAIVRRAFAKFATPEITEQINKSGLGNNPAFIKMFLTIGKEISESTFVDSNSRGSSKKNIEEVLYPSMVQRR